MRFCHCSFSHGVNEETVLLIVHRAFKSKNTLSMAAHVPGMATENSKICMLHNDMPSLYTISNIQDHS
jgi:hypothetical protein